VYLRAARRPKQFRVRWPSPAQPIAHDTRVPPGRVQPPSSARRAARADNSIAAEVREAVDLYLKQRSERDMLDATFGALPDIRVQSRHEWDDDGGLPDGGWQSRSEQGGRHPRPHRHGADT